MASSLENHLDQDGMCSVYSAQPSETNCSINEVLAKEMMAANEVTDDHAEVSIYSVPKSETNVTISDPFQACEAMNKFNVSVYSAPKSETNVTMNNKFERCQDLANVLDYSVYSIPPSETNVTMNAPTLSEYTALMSETDVTMADGFQPCGVLKSLNQEIESSELTAKSLRFNNSAYVEQLQLELGIPDKKVIGLESSNSSIVKIVDSNECLVKLEKFQPVAVDFSQMPEPVSYSKSIADKSIESYLLRSTASCIQHEI
ncbi:hypothetical protein CRE_02007 [Caenorhabditis remanei]|uniref:Uncharacterized protein n=1 Tax=Caenorhabditis remanei TaxID=31234 RepID=E3LGS6_CAERE|nr:hypothetical protein CRE_02007 [Caenorhabditis remanei]